MNSLLLHNINSTNDTPMSYSTQLLDSVTKSFLGIDEWVAQELQRLSYNQIPRNCSNYETLLTIIENITLVEQYITYQSETSTNTDSYNTTTISEITEQEDNSEQKCITKRYQFSQRNLILSFIQLISYCEREKLKVYIQHHRTLLELLIELEKMCDLFINHNMDRSGFLQNTLHTQQSLSCVLFGDQVPISNVLLESWLIISTWVQQGQFLFQTSTSPINDTIQAEQWLKLGISSYQIAKRVCGLHLIKST